MEGKGNRGRPYLRRRVHLLRAVGRQGDLASFTGRRCTLHHQPLRGQGLGPGVEGHTGQLLHAGAAGRAPGQCQGPRPS